MTATVQHSTAPVHFASGWLRWGYRCTCGRVERVKYTQQDAKAAAALHETRAQEAQR